MAIGTHDAQRGVQLSMHCGATAALSLESDGPAFPKADECRDRTVKQLASGSITFRLFTCLKISIDRVD
jgi:hypothetical protein